jgi:hypothetical protein
MPLNSFTSKRLRVTLELAGTNQIFPGTNSNVLVLNDLRIHAQVQAVARLAAQASLRIYGMQQADMDALSVIWANPPVVLDHYVTVDVVNPDGTPSQVFGGTIIEAQPDYAGAPDVAFQILASTGYFQKINAAPATSYRETVDIDLVARDLADKMGLIFENGGAEAILSGPIYLHGTYFEQLVQVCRMARCDFYVLGKTLLITAPGKPRDATPAVVLNKDSGLIGYPSYERGVLVVRAIYDPAFLCGTALDIESIVPAATGRWFPNALVHTLEAITPNGEWNTEMRCVRVLV